MTDEIQKLTMPKWGLSMTEGTVVEWLADEGTTIALGDEIVEIETEKVNNVVEAPVAGVLRRHVAPVGTTVPVGGLIGVVASNEVPDADIDALVAEFEQSFVPEPEEDTVTAPSVATVNGRALQYQSVGDTAADATPLILVHGFTGDLTSWLFNVDALAGDRRVVALDLPGHGGSDKFVDDGRTTYPATAVTGLLDELSITRAHFVGHSLGGAVVAQVAVDRPDLVESLTLIAPAGVGETINGDAISALALADRRRGAREALQALVADTDLISRDMIEQFLRFKRTDGVPAAMALIAGALTEGDRQRIDITDALADADRPVLAIWGTKDTIIRPENAEALPESVDVHLVKDVGHLPHMEAAAEVNRIIADFLSQQSG